MLIEVSTSGMPSRSIRGPSPSDGIDGGGGSVCTNDGGGSRAVADTGASVDEVAGAGPSPVVPPPQAASNIATAKAPDIQALLNLTRHQRLGTTSASISVETASYKATGLPDWRRAGQRGRSPPQRMISPPTDW